MPELPDIVVYVERMGALLADATLHRVRIANPFVLRSVVPALAEIEGKKVRSFERLGKRIIFCLADGFYLVVHLIRGDDALAEFDRGGLEVLRTDLSGFRAAMSRENHTLKRALTDQRIVFASNECNYCARCQTGGKLLADRALSRLLKKNWPRRIEDIE